MERYGNWAPTGFDCKGLASDAITEDGTGADWLVAPVGVNRDTGPGSIERSNWEVLRAELRAADPDGADHETHRFGHWGHGWFELMLVRPGSRCATIAAEAENSLANYPVLDEDDWSQREWDAHAAGQCEDGCHVCESERDDHRRGDCNADCPLCWEEAKREDWERE